MDESSVEDRLSRIATRWADLAVAHQGPRDEALSVQHALLQRYCGAIYRYLLGAVRDPDAAGDLCQEFALRFLRGDFKRADPERGRFRDYVKRALINLVIDYQKRKRSGPEALPEAHAEPAAADPATLEADREFLDRWKEELLARAWAALADHERREGHSYYTVLQFRAANPELTSAQLAEQLAAKLGRRFTAMSVRLVLHRAREQFARLLLAEVSCSLQSADTARLEQELIDLGLYAYCGPILERQPTPSSALPE